MDVLYPIKTTFRNICNAYNFDYEVLQYIAAISGVPQEVIDKMFLGIAVEHAHAEIVLTVLSQRTNCTWDMNNVHVPVLEEAL